MPAPDAVIRPGGRLFRNDLRVEADGTRSVRFTDVTEGSGIDAPGYGMGVAAGDVTNDGCTDLYLTNLGANRLFRNNCDGTFTDVSASSGAEGGGWSVSAAFLDYDRDGRLDLYVGNYVQYGIETDRPCTGLSGGGTTARRKCTRRRPTGSTATWAAAGSSTRRSRRSRRPVRTGPRRVDRRFRRRRLDRHLRRQRRARQPAVDEPGRRDVPGGRPAVRSCAERRRGGGKRAWGWTPETSTTTETSICS